MIFSLRQVNLLLIIYYWKNLFKNFVLMIYNLFMIRFARMAVFRHPFRFVPLSNILDKHPSSSTRENF